MDISYCILMDISINMKLQVGGDLQALHTAQLVYSNRQDLCSDSLHRMTSYWLDQKFEKRTGTIKVLKLLQFLFFVMPMCN